MNAPAVRLESWSDPRTDLGTDQPWLGTFAGARQGPDRGDYCVVVLREPRYLPAPPLSPGQATMAVVQTDSQGGRWLQVGALVVVSNDPSQVINPSSTGLPVSVAVLVDATQVAQPQLDFSLLVPFGAARFSVVHDEVPLPAGPVTAYGAPAPTNTESSPAPAEAAAPSAEGVAAPNDAENSAPPAPTANAPAETDPADWQPPADAAPPVQMPIPVDYDAAPADPYAAGRIDPYAAPVSYGTPGLDRPDLDNTGPTTTPGAATLDSVRVGDSSAEEEITGDGPPASAYEPASVTPRPTSAPLSGTPMPRRGIPAPQKISPRAPVPLSTKVVESTGGTAAPAVVGGVPQRPPAGAGGPAATHLPPRIRPAQPLERSASDVLHDRVAAALTRRGPLNDFDLTVRVDEDGKLVSLVQAPAGPADTLIPLTDILGRDGLRELASAVATTNNWAADQRPKSLRYVFANGVMQPPVLTA